MLPAGGAVNRGMGGATTGTAIEAIGSMYWNPATITSLRGNEMAFGFEGVY
ncbi:MAG: hydrocarbon degradation protein, partial [Planctomycetota bacterium]